MKKLCIFTSLIAFSTLLLADTQINPNTTNLTINSTVGDITVTYANITTPTLTTTLYMQKKTGLFSSNQVIDTTDNFPLSSTLNGTTQTLSTTIPKNNYSEDLAITLPMNMKLNSLTLENGVGNITFSGANNFLTSITCNSGVGSQTFSNISKTVSLNSQIGVGSIQYQGDLSSVTATTGVGKINLAQNSFVSSTYSTGAINGKYTKNFTVGTGNITLSR